MCFNFQAMYASCFISTELRLALFPAKDCAWVHCFAGYKVMMSSELNYQVEHYMPSCFIYSFMLIKLLLLIRGTF